MTVTRSEAQAILGGVDEQVLADVIATGATPAELAEAQAWVENDDAMLDEGRPIPTGRVAELIEILEDIEEAPEPA
ncbi:MAG TPA: hypothetical protein VM434_02665 [Beijerinckiaceae bacterium]|nr:hypothetical protein [Beijerinckiaceae bacterium]